MNKIKHLTALAVATMLGATLVGCSSSSASVSPEETLAIHFGTRGEMHARLDALEGEFEVTSSYWPRANANARISTGLMSGTWDDDGLLMRSSYQGELMGAPTQLVLSTTWDDVRACYVGVWTREDGTSALPLGDGHVDEQGAIVTVRCDEDSNVREVLTIISSDEHTRELYRTTPEGQEYLSWSLRMVRMGAD
jgi:Protein of unknown function (DUF1579)